MQNNQIIRALNDDFRKTMRGGRVVVTAGIAERSDRCSIIAQVKDFAEFLKDNDPHGEHNFGAFDHDGTSCSGRLTITTGR